MWISYALNEYMTPVSVHKCDECDSIFTVCPAISPERIGWDRCLAPTCLSYDPDRDADKMFDEGKVQFRPIRGSNG